MYSPYCLLVVCLVIFTAHSAQPFDDLGVITQSQVQIINGNIVQKSVPIQLENNRVVAAYDPIDKHVYISDHPTKPKNGSVYRIKFSGNPEHPTVEWILTNQQEPITSIVLNDHSNTLYWSTGNTIKKARISKSWLSVPYNGDVLLNLTDSRPGEIQLDACRGYLYFINWLMSGSNNSVSIEKSRLDGTDRKVLLTFNDSMLLSLTLDAAENRLYWAALNPSMKRNHFSLESSDLNGSSRKTLIKGLDHLPQSIAQNGTNIFWYDARTKSLWSTPKTGSEIPVEVIKYHGIHNVPIRIMTAKSRNCTCRTVQKLRTLQADNLLKSTLRQYPWEPANDARSD